MTVSVVCAVCVCFIDPVIPAKNEIQNQETTTSGLGTTLPAWGGS